MININLLPWHLRPIKHSPVPYALSLLVAGLVIVVLVGIWANNQNRIAAGRATLKSNTEKLDALKDVVAEYDMLKKQETVLEEKTAIINEILADRTIWSRQLWNISRLTPDNFWYSSIAVKQKQYSEMRKQINPKTKKEETKKVTLRRPVLELAGYVIEGVDGSNDINPLTFRMEGDTEFSETFQLDLPKFQDTLFEGFKVREFTLEYLITHGGRGA